MTQEEKKFFKKYGIRHEIEGINCVIMPSYLHYNFALINLQEETFEGFTMEKQLTVVLKNELVEEMFAKNNSEAICKKLIKWAKEGQYFSRFIPEKNIFYLKF